MDLEQGYKGLKRTAMEEGVVCGHTCPHHPALVNPSVWSRLPEGLLERVFACLPVADICCLQCLSKRWQQKMTGRSRFKIACTEANRPIIAVVHERILSSTKFWVRMYNVNVKKWHLRKLNVCDSDELFEEMSASDGGLVCFISGFEATKKHPMQILVCNPLTGDKRRLERKGVNSHQVEMLQITTDRNTGHYKVLVGARPARDSLHFLVQLFDSQMDKWISLERPGDDDAPPRDLFFGVRHERKDHGNSRHYNYHPLYIPKGPCVLDSAKLELNVLDDNSRPSACVLEYAVVGDRVYVLHQVARQGDADQNNAAQEQMSTMEGDYNSFTEYQMQTTHPHFVKLKTVRCSHSKLPPSTSDYVMTLCACEGFVLVVAQPKANYHGQIGLLYDLSNDKWCVLSRLPLGLLYEQDVYYSCMCSLRWDACCNPQLSK